MIDQDNVDALISQIPQIGRGLQLSHTIQELRYRETHGGINEWETKYLVALQHENIDRYEQGE